MSPIPIRPSSSSQKTGLDALAIAIGTSHGAYKFSKKPDGSVLKMDVLIKIHQRLPKTHLVMHGSSSVPKDLQDIINQYGGKLKPTWGVPVEEIQLGIRNGVRKINVDTDNRLAITGAIRKVFVESPEKFDPRDYLKPAREAMKKVVAQRMTQFGQAGHARRLQTNPSSRGRQTIQVEVIQSIVLGRARLYRLRKNSGFVSGHRFSDAASPSKSHAPLGAARVPHSFAFFANEWDFRAKVPPVYPCAPRGKRFSPVSARSHCRKASAPSTVCCLAISDWMPCRAIDIIFAS